MKINLKHIFSTLLMMLYLSLICLGLLSCGARKVNKEQSKEEIKSDLIDKSVVEKQSESNIKKTTIVTVNDKNEVISTEETITPIDNTKEASVIDSDGKKTILNNSKKIIKTESKKNNIQTNSVENKDEITIDKSKKQNDIKKIEESKKENSIKTVDKEQFNWLSLWWLYLLILIIGYLIWRIFIKK